MTFIGRHQAQVRLAIAVAMVALNASANRAIELAGTYQYSAYRGRETPEYAALYQFHIWVGDKQWKITYENIRASRNSNLMRGRSEADYDGTNVYIIHPQDPSFGSPSFVAPKTSGNGGVQRYVVATAAIVPGNIPPVDEETVQNLWRAFAADFAFGDEAGKAKPPFLVDAALFANPRYICNYRWVTNYDSQSVRAIVFENDGSMLYRKLRDSALATIKLPAPYDKGYTVAIGRWLQTKSLGDINIPFDYEFTSYTVKPRATNASDLAKAAVYRCLVTNSAITQMPDVFDALTKVPIAVFDRRFAAVGHPMVTYVVTNGFLEATSRELMAIVNRSPTESFEDAALAAANFPSHKSHFGKLGKVILVLVLLSTVAVALKILRDASKTKRSPRQ